MFDSVKSPPIFYEYSLCRDWFIIRVILWNSFLTPLNPLHPRAMDLQSLPQGAPLTMAI